MVTIPDGDGDEQFTGRITVQVCSVWWSAAALRCSTFITNSRNDWLHYNDSAIDIALTITVALYLFSVYTHSF